MKKKQYYPKFVFDYMYHKSVREELKKILNNNPYVNKMLAKKNKIKKEPDFLCNWDFCTTCVAYRKKHKLPMDKLKKHPK